MNDTFKALPPNDCVLDETRVDIWQYPLHTPFVGATELLSLDESTRAKRYLFPRHQRRFTVARAMLRRILARYMNLNPSELVFAYNQHGKPELHHASTIQFNLSHSGDTALLAVGKKHPLGIDLEFFSARPYEGIGKQLFSSSEMLALSQVAPSLKPLVFFHIWAQKEAFIKACGLGLAYPTQDFDVAIFPPANQHIDDTMHNKTWHMRSFMPQLACCAALCHHPLVEEIRYINVDDHQNP